MDFSQFYKELELENNANDDQIKKAYKKLAIKHHPDKNQDNKEEAEAKFKKISEAYQALSDKEKYIRENIGACSRPRHNDFIDPNELFKQFFSGNLHDIFNNNINISMENGMGSFGGNTVMRSSNIRFENGKKIETITEVINGQQRQQTIVTDANQSQGFSFRINGGTNVQHIFFN